MTMVIKKSSVFTDFFIIESPDGKKTVVNPVYSYPPDRTGNQASIDAFYGQIIDIAAEIDECALFIDSEFRPSVFIKNLIKKGYKVYFMNGESLLEGNYEVKS